ncbi:hypothetical protein ACO0RG_004162 [Hanseniaspora osmophila]|uniref:Protein FMP42 n=1 Tax=Hanseniaspora osmophila TaxID=56408 RepID=A0A1E5RAJ4_9ASCO|nr:Protein FMP42 [Hanseniaspora osmophila]
MGLKINLPLLQICCAVIWCLVAAGPIFGFAALKPILVQEGVYADLCAPPSINVTYTPTSNIKHAFTSLSQVVPIKPCDKQDLKLNKIFTIGAVVTNLCSFLVGFVLDKYGPRASGVIGSVFIALGSLVLAYSKSITTFDPYITGYVTLAIGGPFVFISCFQLANSFPQYSGSILALISGAFDTSSALFLFYRLYYQNYNPEYNLKKFFLGYLVVPLFILLCQIFIMPKESYKSISAINKLFQEGLDEEGFVPQNAINQEQDTHERSTLLSSNSQGLHPTASTASGRRKSVLEVDVENKLVDKTQGIFGIMHEYSAIDQIKSPWFILMQVFTILCMLRINYFVATVRSQEEYLLGDYQLALKMNSIFDISLPIGGVIAIPIVGILLDHTPTLYVLCILFGTSVIVGACGLVSSFVINLVGILLLVAYRPFYYTVVSDYCSKVFGFDTFGTVYGLLMTLAGLCNLLQTPLDYWTHTVFNKNPTPVNSILLLLTVVFGLWLLYYVKTHAVSKKVKNFAAIEEEDEAVSEDSTPTTAYGSV